LPRGKEPALVVSLNSSDIDVGDHNEVLSRAEVWTDDRPKWRKVEFSTEPEAVIHACTLIADGATSDVFEVANEAGDVLADDHAIRGRCKQTRTP
jgi:hypothetical protein